VRAEAYLAAHQGSEAAVEFQKILYHSAIVVNQRTPYVLQGAAAKAKAAYQERRPRCPIPETSASGIHETAVNPVPDSTFGQILKSQPGHVSQVALKFSF